MQFPSGQPQALDNEPQLPEGIDPTNVEDVFLDVAQPNHAWSTDEEEEVRWPPRNGHEAVAN